MQTDLIPIKIGELSKRTNESTATLRFWTNEGLLDVERYTAGGYRLYSPSIVKRVKEIRRLQTVERRTLPEIKALLARNQIKHSK
jgi:DNA-binding transcriptional MerR regulator